jgi:hypothetical protein
MSITNIEMNDNNNDKKIYITYHESQKKAIKKYLENNREKINEKRRENHNKRMKEDIEYKINFQNKMRENYLKRKSEKNNSF